jgi:glycosyltransferase involved in cell wall biosynthesis
LLQAGAVNELAQQYRLVLGPVWADPYGLVNYVLPALWPDQVFCHLSDPRDARILPRMAPNYVVVPLYCSSWVNPAWYQPVPFDQKDIDLVMLANFGKYKRHFALFRALRDLPRSTRVVLMGQRHGARTREVLLSEARAYGVADRFELWENAPDADVFRAMARAKTSVILSRREGSCIAVVESLLADTPVAVLAGAEVGSRVFINEQTGRFLAARNLGAQLREFIAQAHCYHPRRWAMDHQIHCQGSSAVLNRVVKETCLAAGEAWTCDLAPFQWRPEPQLLAPADRARLQPARAAVQARFGVQIGKEPPAGG